jgi:hypothetical protein
MKISSNIAGWLRLLFFAFGAAYLWRSGLFPKKSEPQGKFDRSVRIVGAILPSSITIYFLGYGLGFYGLYTAR